jgi:hypothetical protein
VKLFRGRWVEGWDLKIGIGLKIGPDRFYRFHQKSTKSVKNWYKIQIEEKFESNQ